MNIEGDNLVMISLFHLVMISLIQGLVDPRALMSLNGPWAQLPVIGPKSYVLNRVWAL